MDVNTNAISPYTRMAVGTGLGAAWNSFAFTHGNYLMAVNVYGGSAWFGGYFSLSKI